MGRLKMVYSNSTELTSTNEWFKCGISGVVAIGAVNAAGGITAITGGTAAMPAIAVAAGSAYKASELCGPAIDNSAFLHKLEAKGLALVSRLALWTATLTVHESDS